MGKGVFYESIHKASSSLPYLDFSMENINYFSHFHEELEVLFVSEGNMKLTVDTNCYSMESGDIAAVMPGEIHSLSTPVHSRMYIMKFLPAGSAGNDALSRIRLHKRVISSTDEAYPAFRKQIERIYLEASERKPGFAFAVQAAFLEIITLFLRTEGHTVITLAEKDLLLRGSGEFFGTRQHGMDDLKVANVIRDLPILEEARKAAREEISHGLDIKEELARRFHGEFFSRIYH